MKFEYDPDKSEANKVKHGINFEEAQELWNDIDRVNIPVAHKGSDEERHALIGKIALIHWTAIVTDRDGAWRIISVRRSRKEEKKLYEKK